MRYHYFTLSYTFLQCRYPQKAVVSQFESRDWEADLWLLVTPTTRRADSVQLHLRATLAQAILKNVGGRFAAWQNLSTD
jgi:hypothetical protein